MFTDRKRVTVVGVCCALSIGSSPGCDRAPPTTDPPTAISAALSLPVPGQTIVLDFNQDASGNPITRGTILAEQYADWGIHFENGYVIGDRAVDFPDYASPAPDNLICTYQSSVMDPRAISWTDGRCAGGPSSSNVPLVMKLDFPACYVSVQGKGLALNDVLGNIGANVALAGVDAAGVERSRYTSREILNNGTFVGATFHYVSEGTGLAALPFQAGPIPALQPQQGLDVRQVTFTENRLGALDNITLTACHQVVPRCKSQLVCLDAAQQCLSPANVSIDDGSYAWDGQPVTLTHSPPAPYPAQHFGTAVTLTVAAGSQSESCQASVSVGDCQNPPTVTCPGETIVDCAPGNVGADPQCTLAFLSASASDGCSSFEVSADQFCFDPGTTTPISYVAQGLAPAPGVCASSVTVVDRDLPTFGPPLAPSAPTVLWPADGSFHTVTLSDCMSVVDPCEGPLGIDSASITCVTSDERAGANGDIEILDAQTVQVRATRNPAGDGRAYEITFEASDSSGNVGTGSCFVTVPLTQDEGVDVGPPLERVCRASGGGSGGNGGSGGDDGSGSGGHHGTGSGGHHGGGSGGRGGGGDGSGGCGSGGNGSGGHHPGGGPGGGEPRHCPGPPRPPSPWHPRPAGWTR